ncbi:TPA: hypothetical protein DCE37_20130 [Candidatus Latescibacteria bacterium]|nr:hypothetical protein [Candidatus Latescibacterota bacterium]
MSEHIVIQPPVPRAESIRTRLADLAWSEGLSAFVTNSVPFSFSSGRVLAEGLAHLVDALSERDRECAVVELGAGIGYLSAFCLDAIRRDFPKTYGRSTFVVTDGAPDVVSDAEACGLLDRHGGRAKFAIADLRDQESILGHHPRLLLLSYLIDAIPPVHVERKDDGVYVGLIETSIPADLEVIDGGVWPPVRLDANTIVERLRANDVSPSLARKIVPYLEESWSWTRSDVDVTGVMLNSRAEVAAGICDLLEQMPAESGVVVTDFGYVETESIELNEMMTEYGLCAFWAVAFEELTEVASERGFHCYLQTGEEGETHTFLIYKGEDTEGIEQAFTAGFEDMVSDRPRFVLYNLEEDATLEDVQAAIEKIETTMPEADVHSYGNLARFAHLLLQFGDVEGACGFAQRCVDLYPEVAAPEFTILGSQEGRAGRYGAAEVHFREATRIAPGYGNGHFGLSGVHKARKEWAAYFDCMRAYLETADCDVEETMRGIADALSGTDLDHLSRVARRWLWEV